MTAAALSIAAACTVERADVRTPSGEPPEADTTRVRRLLDALADAYSSGDLAAFDTIVHDSLTVFEGGRVDDGWRTYRDDHLAAELAALDERRLRFEAVRVRLSGSTAWATGRYTLSAMHEGREIVLSGLATAVFWRHGGSWRLAHWHLSAG